MSDNNLINASAIISDTKSKTNDGNHEKILYALDAVSATILMCGILGTEIISIFYCVNGFINTESQDNMRNWILTYAVANCVIIILFLIPCVHSIILCGKTMLINDFEKCVVYNPLFWIAGIVQGFALTVFIFCYSQYKPCTGSRSIGNAVEIIFIKYILYTSLLVFLIICYLCYLIFKCLYRYCRQNSKQQTIEMQNIIDTDKKITCYVQEPNLDNNLNQTHATNV
jgi:hypothetical protein